MVSTDSREGAFSFTKVCAISHFILDSVVFCEEALEAILMYSESAKQLLRRKKVRREHIFQYLAEKQIYASASADKTTLMRKVLDLWGTQPDVGAITRVPADHEVSVVTEQIEMARRGKSVHNIMRGRGLDESALWRQYVHTGFYEKTGYYTWHYHETKLFRTVLTDKLTKNCVCTLCYTVVASC